MGFATNLPWEHRKSVSLVVDGGIQLTDRNASQDVLFGNVKHVFFQPCDHELLVILHIHLKAPIMIGKKKTYVWPHRIPHDYYL